jgi:hypothetical protein
VLENGVVVAADCVVRPHLHLSERKDPMNQDESSLAQNVSSTLSDAKQRLQQTAREAASTVKERASEVAHERKSGLADQIDNYREVIDKRTGDIEQDDPNLAWLSHEASNRLRRASDYLRSTELDQMKADAENVARRHPALFFGGLFLGGVILGNFLKASAENGSETSSGIPVATTTYPESEDVVKPLDESISAQPVPPSEAIK